MMHKDGGSDGASNGIKRMSVKGGTLETSYPQDNVNGMKTPNPRGGTFGGSTTNLSHSLNGASAVQK